MEIEYKLSKEEYRKQACIIAVLQSDEYYTIDEIKDKIRGLNISKKKDIDISNECIKETLIELEELGIVHVRSDSYTIYS